MAQRLRDPSDLYFKALPGAVFNTTTNTWEPPGGWKMPKNHKSVKGM